MRYSNHNEVSIFDIRLLLARRNIFTAILVAATILAAVPGHAQTFSVIHSFSGPDGANPLVGVMLDGAGNLYGTTGYGGTTGGFCQTEGCGTVFKLSHAGSGWLLSQLLRFNGQNGGDGLGPLGRVVFGPDGSLYGTASCCSGGTVFNLSPQPTFCHSVSCPWMETVINRFGYLNGAIPGGDLVFDSAGNLYGTTQSGGNYQKCGGLGCGEIYMLSRSNGGWTQQTIYSFLDGVDGEYPASGVIVDSADNLYGTAPQDGVGSGNGLVFQLTRSGSGWIQTVLYHFQAGADGQHPWGGLISDEAGNLYGTTTYGGSGQGGTVFELSPSGGGWTFNLIYDLPGGHGSHGSEAKLVRDNAGNLYGTTVEDGAYGHGTVFKLSRSGSGWTYVSLHDFTGGDDGGYPYGGLVLGSDGTLYGTAVAGGNVNHDCSNNYCGVVFEISP